MGIAMPPAAFTNNVKYIMSEDEGMFSDMPALEEDPQDDFLEDPPSNSPAGPQVVFKHPSSLHWRFTALKERNDAIVKRQLCHSIKERQRRMARRNKGKEQR